jgi:hypothetical protein
LGVEYVIKCGRPADGSLSVDKRDRRGRQSIDKSAACVRLGLVSVRGDAHEYQFMREMIVDLNRRCPNLELIVVGQTFDDLTLLRTGNTFATGAVDADELASTIRRYRLNRILLCLTRPLFGHPIASAAMAAPVPVAYFDWSRGRHPARLGDLTLSPSQLAGNVAAELVSQWQEAVSA